MAAFQEQEYSDKKIDWRMWWQLIRISAGEKKHLIGVAVCMTVNSIIDVLSPLITAYFIDHNIMTASWDGIWVTGGLYVTAICVQSLMIYLFIHKAGYAETGIMCDIRSHAFERLQKLSFSYYDRTAVGYIMARLTSDASRLGETISWSLVDVFWSIMYMILAAIAMLVYNWKLALLILGTVIPIAVVSLFFQRKMLKSWRGVRRINSRITGAFNEGITGARTTKTLVREELNEKEFKGLTHDMRQHSVRAAMLSALFMPLVMTIGAVGTALVLWKGGVQVMIGGITLGEFTFFVSLGSMFFEPINNLARILAEMQSSQAAVERVVTLINTEPEIMDSPEAIEKYGELFAPKRENWPDIKGDVVFEHVSFAYQGGQKVLDDFNLTVKAGQKIALVGETGSGKSTIVNLICRFYEPTEGRILIDGVDYRERTQLWLHSNLGYVLQSPQLFSGSIRENIRYGRLSATDEEVERAAKLVDAHNFIVKMEKGYDTQVGEGGGRLSTGEKQLISFARAIVADPALFVLDEATSSIDTETEQMIQHAIETVLHGRTSFIIAHRLSTIRSADRILVVREGVVREDGTHQQLMRQKGYYYNLYTTQFQEEAQNRLMGQRQEG
ncbi:MAG: ABC transporter ATP-binding protein [Eubacteriales bacterium]|nr:ABC transporter ATP-binding protein [Eubacteriales bacterium]